MTPKAFVIGWPIAHSRSPLIHGTWLETHGVAGAYEKIAVCPEDLAPFVASMRANGFVGGNVTIPHKEAMARLVGRLTPDAAKLGAVNTIWFDGETLVGDTTDGIGFVHALDQEAPGWDRPDASAIVLGAGGAARPIVEAIQRRGCRVTVASRTAARAATLAADLGCAVCDLAEVADRFPATDLLVNTTPAGMTGAPGLGLDLAALPDHAVVDDIVYVPSETPLLRDARARGLRTVGGLGMLLHQAVPGFEHWFGIRPAVTPALRATIEADIARGA